MLKKQKNGEKIIFGVLPETTRDYLHTRSIFPQSLDVKVSDKSDILFRQGLLSWERKRTYEIAQ